MEPFYVILQSVGRSKIVYINSTENHFLGRFHASLFSLKALIFLMFQIRMVNPTTIAYFKTHSYD